MSAKKYKALRRIARIIGQGLPERRLLVGRSGRTLTGNPWVIAVNDPKSIRGIYRQLKKAANYGKAHVD